MACCFHQNQDLLRVLLVSDLSASKEIRQPSIFLRTCLEVPICTDLSLDVLLEPVSNVDLVEAGALAEPMARLES